jgi:hypothetical protein
MIINSFDFLPKDLGLRSNRKLSESAAKINFRLRYSTFQRIFDQFLKSWLGRLNLR